MKKYTVILIFIWILAISLLIVQFWPEKEIKTNSSSKPSPTISINYSNIEKELSKNSIIKSIPENKEILLRFYNSDSGEKEFENNYILTKGKISKTEKTNSEIILSLNSRYLTKLTNKNLCEIIKEATNNGDLDFEIKISIIKLAWDFRSLNKYKSCLG